MINIENRQARTLILLALTVIVAFCSILYEFILAQVYAATMGGTVFRYNLTIGFYCASLGAGAITVSRRKWENPTKSLLTVELLLSVIGASSIFIIILIDKWVFVGARWLELQQHDTISLFLNFVHIFFIGVIGFLSGIELPLLMKLGQGVSGRVSTWVLVIDYVGTLTGAIVFPLFLLPELGLFFSAISVALLNMVAAVVLCFISSPRYRIRTALAVTGVIVLSCLLLWHEEISINFIQNVYF